MELQRHAPTRIMPVMPLAPPFAPSFPIRSREAAGIVQPLNPLLSDEKLVSLLRTAGAKLIFAYGSDEESGIWSKAMRIRHQVPTLSTVLRVAPLGETVGAAGALPEGVVDFN